MSQDTTQAKFRKSPKKDSEQPQIEENEVRIKGNMGNVKRYVDYACNLLKKDDRKKEKDEEKKEDKNQDDNDDDNENKDDKKNEEDSKKKVTKQFKTIVLKATGRAINKAVTTAEVVKRRIVGLHQDTKLETLEIVDVWEPTEEGLQTVETTRRVASITIKLSYDEEEIAKMKKNTGYQPPLAADSIKTSDYPVRQRNYSRGNRRGGYNRYNRGYNRRGGYNRNYNNYYGNRNYRGGYNNRRGGGSYNRDNNYYGSNRGSSYGNRSYRGGSSYNRNYNRY